MNLRILFIPAVITIMSVPVAACCEMDDDDETGTAGTQASSGGAGGSAGSGGGGGGGGGAAATHTGIVSVQDVTIHGAPQAGHGLTVQILFTELVAPTYEEEPGLPIGCRGWVYDVNDAPPPALGDHGVVEIAGVDAGSITCSFQGGAYVCPVWSASAQATVTPGEMGVAVYSLAGSSFGADDVGRYLRVSGSMTPNDGAFPIVATSAGAAVVFNPNAIDAQFDADAVVVAGAGPVPGNAKEVFSGRPFIVGIEPGGGGAFDFPDTPAITPGSAFTLDDASKALIAAVPLDGSAMTLGCSGAGGTCGAAQGTIIRILTTDGSVEGLPPFAMPPPSEKQVEIHCAVLGDGLVTVPGEAMKLLADVHAASPITRIRTAFMREGIAQVENPAPQPPNPVFVVAGRGVLGFTTP